MNHGRDGKASDNRKTVDRWRPRLVFASRMVLIIVAALVTVGVLGLPVYVFPAEDRIAQPDAIFILGPAKPERMDVADQAMSEGSAARALVTVGKPGWGWTFDDVPECLSDQIDCFTPYPFSTIGEASAFSSWAAEVGASKPLVITATPHVARTRYIFDKCSGTDVAVVGVNEGMTFGDWVGAYVYESAAFVKAIVSRCPPSSLD